MNTEVLVAAPLRGSWVADTSTPDPKSSAGGAFQDRYAAHGNQVITTSEQVLQMAPRDPYWRFRIAEQLGQPQPVCDETKESPGA